MKAQLLIHINETPVLAEMMFSYIRGRPAYTPRGEYAPIDPPEPPEVDIQTATMRSQSEKDWHEAPQWLVNILANDEDIINQLIEIAEESNENPYHL